MVTDNQIQELLDKGKTLQQVLALTGAGNTCGSCKNYIQSFEKK